MVLSTPPNTSNAAGRMVRAENVTSTLVYTYNAAGLRVAQSVKSSQSVFSWDWASALPEMLAQSPNPQSPNQRSLYLVGHDTLGRWDGAAWAYHLPDALGSVRQVADGAGAVVSAREWTPYGVEVGGAQAGLGYTGEWFDADAGLQYLRARWYAPQTGRFVSRDPLRGIAWEPQSINGFPYVTNNPIKFIDPSGYQTNDCTSWPPRLRWMCEKAEQGDLNVISLIYSGIVVGGLAQDKPVTAFLMYHFLMGYGQPVRLSHEFVLQSAAASAARDNLRRSYLRDKIRSAALGLSSGQSASVSAKMRSSRVIASDSEAVWFAMGRFYIHANYEGGVARDCVGYYVSYVGEYRINDAYDWHGEDDPEGPLYVHIPVGEYNLWVPDEWAEDLVEAGVAFEFYMYVHWFEKETVKIGPTWRIPESRATEWEPFLDLPPIWGTP